MDLEQTLSQVSKNCLRGQPVPHDLALLWIAQLKNDPMLTRRFALTLIEEISDGLFEGYYEPDGTLPHLYQRMFDQIAFVAQVEDGALIGYWLGEENRSIAESPIIELDNEGQFYLHSRNLADYLLVLSDSDTEEEFSEIKIWLQGLGIPITANNHEEIWEKLGTFDDPGEQFRRYHEDFDSPE